jgi:hypothetical protein
MLFGPAHSEDSSTIPNSCAQGRVPSRHTRKDKSMITAIGPQNNANFPSATTGRTAQVSSAHPVNPFSPPVTFVAYQTDQPSNVLAADACPYQGAAPNYVPVNIPANVAFTVQNLNLAETINVDV